MSIARQSNKIPSWAIPRPPFTGIEPMHCFIPAWMNTTRTGYRQVNRKWLDKSGATSRLSFLTLVGAIPEKANILHRCGDGRCHNPYHLYVGGDSENSRDTRLHKLAKELGAEIDQRMPSKSEMVFKPPLIAFSGQACQLGLAFAGFRDNACHHSDWLLYEKDGYALLNPTEYPGWLAGAHRLVYEMFVGKLDKYDIIGHTCGDKKCLNPYHLYYAGQPDCLHTFEMLMDPRFTLTVDAIRDCADQSILIKDVVARHNIHPQTASDRRRALRQRTENGRPENGMCYCGWRPKDECSEMSRWNG